jgi:putative copper export protein
MASSALIGGASYGDALSGDESGGRAAAWAPPRCARFPPVKRTAVALVSILATMLLLAPAAMAENGVGLAGPTTDKTVTFFCFGVIAFFAILPIVMSLIQGKLEKRKERRRTDLQRFN